MNLSSFPSFTFASFSSFRLLFVSLGEIKVRYLELLLLLEREMWGSMTLNSKTCHLDLPQRQIKTNKILWYPRKTFDCDEYLKRGKGDGRVWESI